MQMMNAAIQLEATRNRGGHVARAITLMLGTCLLALGCNTFDPQGVGSSGPGQSAPSTSPPAMGTGGFGAVMTPGPSPSDNAPPGSVGVPGCIQCGSFCADCGRGCECKEGHTPFDAPPWMVPFSPIGDDGWMDSSRTLCAGMDSVISTRMWVRDDGVYALVGGMAHSLIDVGGFDDDDAGIATAGNTTIEAHQATGTRTRVFHNGGGGWALRADFASASAESGLTGFPSKALLLYGGHGQDDNACPLGVVDGTSFACQPVVGTVQSAIAVNDRLAFALTGSRDVLVFDGSSWHSTATLPAPANALWANENVIVAVGPEGKVMTMEEGSWAMDDVGQLARLTAVWGTSRDDLWVGGFNGALFHFDGEVWSESGQLGGVSCATQPPIEHIWGVGSEVWVSTATQLARIRDGVRRTFGNWTCASVGTSDKITGLWGRGADDVFIAVSNEDPLLTPCGGSFVVHFDGQSFHRF